MSFNFIPIERTNTIDEAFTNVNDNFANLDAAFDNVDTDVSNLAGAIQDVDARSIRFKVFQAVTSTGGQSNFTTPEPYQVGRLIVYSGGLLQIEGVHWNSTGSQAFQFVEGREAGEVVQAFEYQVGSDSGDPFPIGTITVFTSTEDAVGTIDSTDGTDGNGAFTVARAIHAGSTPEVRISGAILLVPITEFTWTGNTITILAPNKPVPGETVVVKYEWSN